MIAWFEFKLKNYPRTWTKSEWKQVHSYFRRLRRSIVDAASVKAVVK